MLIFEAGTAVLNANESHSVQRPSAGPARLDLRLGDLRGHGSAKAKKDSGVVPDHRREAGDEGASTHGPDEPIARDNCDAKRHARHDWRELHPLLNPVKPVQRLLEPRNR